MPASLITYGRLAAVDDGVPDPDVAWSDSPDFFEPHPATSTIAVQTNHCLLRTAIHSPGIKPALHAPVRRAYLVSMIMHPRPFTNYGRFLVPALCGLLLLGCGDNDPTGDGEVLCGGESGVGLHVEGRAQPVDVCVSDAAVDALMTVAQRYDITAQVTLDDDSVVQVRMVFTHRPDAPVTLRLVNSITEATSDPGAVYVFYEEIPDGGTPIQSTLITGGKFRLSFNDDLVAVGTMENIHLDMNNVQTGDPAGERQIVEGFFSVTVAPPAANDVSVR